MWIEDGDEVPTLLVLLCCLAPTVKMMNKALQLSRSSEARIANRKGDQQCESSDADFLSEFQIAYASYQEAVAERLHSMTILRHFSASQVAKLKNLCFRLLARGGACVQRLMWDQYLAKAPFPLLAAVTAGFRLPGQKIEAMAGLSLPLPHLHLSKDCLVSRQLCLGTRENPHKFPSVPFPWPCPS